jgi:hypothetical protein
MTHTEIGAKLGVDRWTVGKALRWLRKTRTVAPIEQEWKCVRGTHRHPSNAMVMAETMTGIKGCLIMGF